MAEFIRLGAGRRRISLLVLGIASFLPVGTVLAEKACSPQMSERASSLLIKDSQDWQLLRTHQRAFAVCDDGELGEEYSDVVVKLLSQGEGSFEELAAIAEEDPDFQRWAVKHIDASTSDDDLRRIIDNAASCKGIDSVSELCNIVRTSAESALAESLRSR